MYTLAQGEHRLLLVPFAPSVDEHFVHCSFLSFRKSASVYSDPFHTFFSNLERHPPKRGAGPGRGSVSENQPTHRQRPHRAPAPASYASLGPLSFLKSSQKRLQLSILVSVSDTIVDRPSNPLLHRNSRRVMYRVSPVMWRDRPGGGGYGRTRLADIFVCEIRNPTHREVCWNRYILQQKHATL